MGERVLSDTHLEKVAKFREANNIPSFPISRPEEFDKFVDLTRIARDYEDLKTSIVVSPAVLVEELV